MVSGEVPKAFGGMREKQLPPFVFHFIYSFEIVAHFSCRSWNSKALFLKKQVTSNLSVPIFKFSNLLLLTFSNIFKF